MTFNCQKKNKILCEALSISHSIPIPNVTGCWLFTEIYKLIQENPNEKATLKDIQRTDDHHIRLEQRGEFVTWSLLESYEGEPHNRLGIWKPVLADEKLISWQLLLADYANINTGIIQVLETDSCGDPVILWVDTFETYSSPTDPSQTQGVTRGILVREGYKNITNTRHRFTPPNISGLWIFADRHVIVDDNLKREATLKDITRANDVHVKVKQLGEFVTWKLLETSDHNPVLLNRLGIWNPKLVNGKLVGWQLLLADYDDTNIGFLQVLEVGNCDKPDKPNKLSVILFESFTSPINPLQAQTVSTGTMIRIKNNKLSSSKRDNLPSPPDISGRWFLTNHYSIIDDPNINPTVCDIAKRADVPVKIKQKGRFITWKFLETSEQFGILRNRLGVWNPNLINCEVIGWEVVLADWDDTNFAFIQVLETDECGKPVKLILDLTESLTAGISNAIEGLGEFQAQTASRGIVFRQK